MPGGYIIDPATGMPAVQTAGGVMLPLPLSDEQLRAAGAQLGPDGPPMPGPDLRVAGPGGGRVGAPVVPRTAAELSASGSPGRANATPEQQAAAQQAQEQAAAQQAAAERAHLEEVAASSNGRAAASAKLALERANSADAARAAANPPPPSGVDPGSLARQRPQVEQPAAGGSALDSMDPAVRAVFEESLRGGGGGGGPRGLGQTGETRKLKTTQYAMDPELAQQAQQAQLASQGYDEQLAVSLQQRQQQAYEAQQSEYASRAGQLQAQQVRFEQQQAMLQDYAAKRDAAIEEARQLKAPQMEEYWGSRSTLANVMTGLSIALGGALQGLRGGQNPGLEMSNQSIERWLQAKRTDYENVKDNADRMDTQFGRMVQQFGSENQALEHMRLQAWEVRDGMLKSYAEKIGTPDALENYNQAMLKSEAEKAAAQARASQGAEVEIEQKLSMQGGGGGGRKTLRQAIADAASTSKDLRTIAGDDGKPSFQREVQSEKVEGITGALEAIEAADEVEGALGRLGSDSDIDDPLSGVWDSTAGNIPGTETRAIKQRLQQQTRLLARGIQKSLGKSDNDAKLADEMAEGGGSVSQRRMAAKTAKQRAAGSLQNIVSSLTPDQQQTLLRSLEANSPARAAQVRSAIAAVASPQIAASERPAF